MKITLKNYIFSITLLNMLIYHFPLYSYALSHMEIGSFNGILTFFSMLVALFTVTAFLLFLIATLLPSSIKPFTMLMVITNSMALYFVNTFHVILDKSMLGNAFNTKTAEVMGLYDPKIFLYILFLGILPAFLIYKVQIIETKRLKLLLSGIGTLVGGVLLMYLNSTTWLWLDKNAKILGGMSMPWSYSINAIRFQLNKIKKSKKAILLPDAALKNEDKMLVVLIIGESARAANFSLYGYNQETNPLLKKENITVLKNTQSATTYTTASIHTMLSYKGSTSDDYEPLPNYLQRIGVDVIWRSNNWGQPKLKVGSYLKKGELRKSCEGEKCSYDELLLTNLNEEIINSKKDKVFVVLHTNGSHGPTYYKKYPSDFEHFIPVCKSVNLQSCTQQELINAYDNSILYTDYFISQVINQLKELENRPSLLLYISDHGESLGENGFYLHGTPYAIAPDVQKDIPFIVWQSEEFLKRKDLKTPYIKPQESYGQENIFHTILGAFETNSTVYNEKRDLLHP